MANLDVKDEQNIELLNNKNITSLALKLKRKSQSRGFNVTDDDIVDEIMSAIDTVNEIRRFEPKGEELYEIRFNEIILKMCLCSIAKYGAEGQTSHRENGIERRYENGSSYPKSLLQKIIPLAKGR